MAAPTPEQYLGVLTAQLGKQAAHAKQFDAYYTGARRLRLIEDEYRDVFGILPDAHDLLALRPPDTNVSAVGVQALVERIQVEDFTSGTPAPAGSAGAVGATDGADADTEAEDTARALWLGSDMDVMQGTSVLESLVKGRSFLLNTRGPDGVVMSVEDCQQMAVWRTPEPPYDVMAALKIWPDPWGGPDRGKLWITDLVADLVMGENGWTVGEFTRHGLDRPPVTEVAYRQRLLDEPRSYIEPVATLADSYALLMAYLVIAARYGAIPVRTMSGIVLPRDPRNSAIVLPFGTDPRDPTRSKPISSHRALASENPDARFGQLDAGNLSQFIAAIDMILSSIVSITRVPQHYYGQGATSGTSGEMLKSSEAGLVRRVGDAQRYLGSAYRKAVSQATTMELGRRVSLTPNWSNTETMIEAQQADAAGKYVAAGIPLEVALRKVGWPAELIQDAVSRASTDQANAQRLMEQLSVLGGAGGASAPVSDPLGGLATDAAATGTTGLIQSGAKQGLTSGAQTPADVAARAARA